MPPRRTQGDRDSEAAECEEAEDKAPGVRGHVAIPILPSGTESKQRVKTNRRRCMDFISSDSNRKTMSVELTALVQAKLMKNVIPPCTASEFLQGLQVTKHEAPQKLHG